MKKIGVGIGLLIILSTIIFLGLDSFFANRFSKLINSNPNRKYDIVFEELSINLWEQGIKLSTIQLLTLTEDPATKVRGSLSSIELSGVRFLDLIFDKKLTINRVLLNEPAFRLIHQESEKRSSNNSRALQDIFQDIISRGEISNFELRKGTAEFLFQGDSLMPFGNFTDLNIKARGIVSDSIIIQNLVPFQLESIEVSLKNLKLNTLDNQTFKLGELGFDSGSKSIFLKEVSLAYDDFEKTTSEMKYQDDVIEFTLDSLALSYIDAKNNIYGDWKIIAGLAEIHGLVLEDFRDKNLPRPDELEKPLFEGMVEQIPFPIELDTIRLSDSEIRYRELLPGNSKPGELKFTKVKAEVLNVMTLDSLQSGAMTIAASALFNDLAQLKMDIQVPYGEKSFSLQARVGSFQLAGMNEMLERMANVKVASGQVKELLLEMRVSRYGSSNRMTFQYDDLKLELLGDDHSKKKLKSALANIFTGKRNLISDPNYKKASYVTERNIYRGPFHLMWQSTKEGMIQIVPSDLAQLFVK